jgi:plastocyanin
MRSLITLLVSCAIAVSLFGCGTHTSGKQVTIGDHSFTPSAVTINRGEAVIWTRSGQKPHNVTFVKGPASFKPSATETHGTYVHKFTKVGTYTIEDSVNHFRMTVTVR